MKYLGLFAGLLIAVLLVGDVSACNPTITRQFTFQQVQQFAVPAPVVSNVSSFSFSSGFSQVGFGVAPLGTSSFIQNNGAGNIRINQQVVGSRGFFFRR